MTDPSDFFQTTLPNEHRILAIGPGAFGMARRFAARGWIVDAMETAPTATEATRLLKAHTILLMAPRRLTETRTPDCELLIALAKSVASSLRFGQLVVVVDSPYPGAGREIVLPLLREHGTLFELAAASTLCGDPAHPERWALGGIEQSGCERACALFARIATPVAASSLEAAEAAGLVEGLHRTVAAALANELTAAFAQMGLDPKEVLEIGGTGFRVADPGPGGLAPIAFTLSRELRKFGGSIRLAEMAAVLESLRPSHLADRITEALNAVGKPVKKSRILLFGTVPGSGAMESPAREIFERLRLKGASVVCCEPDFAGLPPNHDGSVLEWLEYPLAAEVLAEFDAILLLRPIPEIDCDSLLSHSTLILDACQAFGCRNVSREKIVRV
jgi:UDP-N-acetyl-D-glucosamine dehydrogenase